MNRKIAILIFYFGPFPEHFPLFLRSCEHNPYIDWFIYTDNRKTDTWPKNVIYHGVTLSWCRERFQNKIPYPICLSNPIKICDYRPLFGYLMEEELQGYDFWGHCDLDQIFGKIDLKDEDLSYYDKLYTLGHFTLYRNRPDVNQFFLRYQDGNRVKIALQMDRLAALDEWGSDNVNEAFLKSDFHFLAESYGADIWPGSQIFRLSEYNRERDRYYPLQGTSGILKYEKGFLFFINSDYTRTEVPYVHFQKRTLKMRCEEFSENYYITPEGFLPELTSLDQAMKKGLKRPIIDRQFWKIKQKNIRSRLRNTMSNFIKNSI